ncbi:hypothetical protein BD779DRAFT_1478115 [Infundibulicybe gibba]|nr:hypothetical protein BD779DRAFT_1478115 [Infundibulicybe gibba]
MAQWLTVSALTAYTALIRVSETSWKEGAEWMMQGNSMDGGRSGAGERSACQRYSDATVSNIEALDEEKRALHGVLDALREYRAREERTIEVTIANIHRRRNGLIPISRLPPEILSQIFVLHAKLEPLKWTEAALTSIGVCKQWRQIGLDCPELWSFFDDHSVAWMAKMMERSHSVPLTVSIIKQEDMSSRKMALIADNMYRFEYLDLHIPTANTHRFLEPFSGPVPLLENLDIVYLGDATFVFLSDFLGGSAPNLRHIMLTITDSYVPWTSGLFAHLVTLNIDRDADGKPDGPEAPSLGVLLSALTRMPGLEILILSGCLPSPTSSAITAHVDLPKLDYLRTSGLLGNTTYLFRHITINASAAMNVRITCLRVSKEDVKEFFAIFPSRLCTSPSLVAQALKFDWQGPFSFRAEAWRKLARTSPNLRRLAVGNDTVQCVGLLNALHLPDGQGLIPTDCYLPALSYLELSAPPIIHQMGKQLHSGCPVPELVFVSSSEEGFVGDWSKPFRDAVPGIIVRTIERGEEVIVYNLAGKPWSGLAT